MSRVEFMVEPFHDGNPGPHVLAAIDAVRRLGFEPEVGPFGTTIEGDSIAVVGAIAHLLQEAVSNGAHHVSIRFDLDS